MGIKGLAKVSLLYTQKKSYIIKMVNTFQIASIAAIATTAFAYTSEKYEVGSCNTGKIHCCSTDKDVKKSTGKTRLSYLLVTLFHNFLLTVTTSHWAGTS